MFRCFCLHSARRYVCTSFPRIVQRPSRLCLRRMLSAVPRSQVQSIDVVQSLAAAVENDPALAEKLSRTLDSATVERIEGVLESHASEEPSKPSSAQLRMVAVAASIPFFGFGVLDNAVMIMLGEVIDATLCVKFGFSTMMAAALGNTFSDAIGVFSGSMIEDLAQRYGVGAPQLSRSQETMSITKNFERLGQLVGIIVGCFVGMFPLLFMGHSDITKREKALNEMFDTVIEKVATLLDCDAAMLLLIDREKGQLVPRCSSDARIDQYRSKLGTGISGTVAETGEFLNIDDVPNTDHYVPERHDNYFGTGIKVESVLCWPIWGTDPSDQKYKVLGVLQVINKHGDTGFTDKDEDVVAALCSHISTSHATAYGVEEGFQHTLTNCERTLNMRGVRLNPAQDRRLQLIYEEVMRDCTEVLNGSTTMLLVSDEKSPGDMILKVSDKVPPFRHHSSFFPILGKCRDEKVSHCVNDLINTAYYNPDLHENYQGTNINVRAVLAAPCISTDGEVLAVLACLKGEDTASSPFLASDVRFLNSVASNIAINLQGSGASLQRVLQQVRRQHTRELSEATLEQEDCSKEVLSILDSVVNLVQKAGGKVDQREVRAQTSRALERQEWQS